VGRHLCKLNGIGVMKKAPGRASDAVVMVLAVVPAKKVLAEGVRPGWTQTDRETPVGI